MKIDFSTLTAIQISAMYFFAEMIATQNVTRFPISSDLSLRGIIRNFGDDFTSLVISRNNLGVKAVGFNNGTWDGVCQFAVGLKPLMRLKSREQYNAGKFYKYKIVILCIFNFADL